MAWRRYTKHSKNKVQEISGALLPLVEKYRNFSPFYGAIIAGNFTKNSIDQLISEGFQVVYFPLSTIEQSFLPLGINAHWEESTPEVEIHEKILQFEKLSRDEVNQIIHNLIRNNLQQLETFKLGLCKSIERKIDSIRIISVFGNSVKFLSVKDAYNYIANHNEMHGELEFYKYEIYVKYSNGDKIEMQFREKQPAITFLKQLM